MSAPGAGADGGGKDVLLQTLNPTDSALIRAISSSNQNFVVSDATAVDNPIIFASESFYELTGFAQNEVIGRNCRFLQGPATDRRAVQLIREGISRGGDGSLFVLLRTEDTFGELEAPGEQVVDSSRGFDGATGKVERVATGNVHGGLATWRLRQRLRARPACGAAAGRWS